MKIVLIGKNGQLGSALVQTAKQYKHTLSAYAKDEFDITNKEQIANILRKEKPSILINTSAFHLVQECENEPEKAFLINSVAIKWLAEACAKQRIQFITYSSDYVFDGHKNHTNNEDEKPNPLQIYGISKLAGEYIASQYTDNALIIRTCGVYNGKSGSRSKKGNFVINILRQAEGKDTLEVSSEQIVNPTYAVDLALGTYELVKKQAMPGIYHLASEGYCSWAEFAQEIMEIKNKSTKIIPVDRREDSIRLKRPLFSALENKKAKKEYQVILPDWKIAVKKYLQTL